MSQVLVLLIGTCLGIVSSGVFWWIQNHLIVPELIFCEEISKKKNSFTKKGWVYRVKIRNVGKRNAIDVSFLVKYAIRGLHYNNLTWLTIPSTPDHVPLIGRQIGDRIVRLHANLIDLPLEAFPNSINNLRDRGSLTIEHLLNLDQNSFIVVYVFAYDEYSGVRKLYTSKKYYKRDIRLGRFGGYRGLGIIKDTANIEGWSEKLS